MFKKFLELMARKFFRPKSFSWDKQKKSVKSMEEEWKKNRAKGKNFDGSPKTPRRPEEDWLDKRENLTDRLKSGKKVTNKELSERYGMDLNPEVQRKGKRGIASGKLKGKLSKEDVQRSQRQRKSVKKYRADVDKGAGKWSPSRGIAPWKKTTSGKHLLNTPAASLVGAGTAASLTRNKKRKK